MTRRWKFLAASSVLAFALTAGPAPCGAPAAASTTTPASAPPAVAQPTTAAWMVLPGGLRWAVVGPPEPGDSTLECWLPAGSGVSGGQAAAATATALHASLQARLPAPCRIEVELTTTHVRYVVHVPPASTTEAGAGLLDVLTSSPVVGPQGTLPQPRWLHEADIGPWLAAAPSSKAVDVVAFHGRHYRLEAMGLVLGAHPTPGRVGEALAEHLARRTKLPAEVASPAPNGHATPDGTASGPVPLHEASRWACLAVEGPPPDAWAEAAALAVAGEVLASRLSGPLNRRVNVTLEAAPGKTWLVLASQAPGERFATTLEGQLAALRDDTVDLAELEQARTRVRAALGDPAHDKGTRLRGVGRDMVLGRPGATAQALAAVAQVGRTEVQAAAQRFCCGPGLRIRVPEP